MAECPFPVRRKVRKKNGEVGFVQTPCGICETCRKNFAHMWGTRVYHESLSYDKCCFLTLTYAPEKMPFGDFGLPTINIEDVQNFLKRWREYIYPEKIRYFCGCEYSPLNHLPHYHIAVFGADMWDKRVFSNHVKRDDGYSVDCRFWDKGFVHVGKLEIGSACYIAGYALKKVMGSQHKNYYQDLGICPPRALMSRNPGIGAKFAEKYSDVLRRLGSCTVDSWVTALPRYYIDKIDFKNTDTYKDLKNQELLRHLKSCEESFSSNEKLFDSIRSRLNAQEFYRDKEVYHNQLKKDWKI